uniref:polysaccharide deacetylase family protein n=1 Tax=Marinobacterium jannaschii TaxID=64970 RepID=UPI000688DFAE|nr:polysaccharide deacetylase family protein [Marinobacterium jannaschii]
MIVIAVLVLAALYFSAHYNWWRKPVSMGYPRVLMYHSVNTEYGNLSKDLVVSPDSFESQLKYLSRRGYRFCTVSELLGLEPEARSKCVVLTFDDGFRDNYTHMFPLLKQFNAKATIYLAPAIPDIERLDQEQILEMQQSGLIEFGAHTMHHINLDKAGDETARSEIEESKAAVERLTGRPCQAFAYPFGRYNSRNVEQVRAAGMSNAVTVKKGIDGIDDPFRIKRISVLGSTSTLQFHLAMTRGRYRV